MRYIYLHGFASSPASRKARLFSERLAQEGIALEALDLAPDFSALTVTSQLEVVERTLRGEPAVIIGSSLGGYLAALYAEKHPETAALVLLAPAFNFHSLWIAEIGPVNLKKWRETGSIPVFHYGAGRTLPLGYQMIADAEQYQGFPDVKQPCLVLHGLEDKVVPFGLSAEFAARHPNSTLISFKSGHELADVLDEIWNTSRSFLLERDTNRVQPT